ncbi:DUF3307 domain-containing protein [Stenotrophomonas sp. GD03657]|uniref:DUF3307 domain-containing protein n=1 Tax=Stenotrophomonas sp. GD03657 TaxID=2975363 RepID=UPI00244A7106|nr:DUF3307 domain-containing protein [Stenotrophomonas sp. GD03657]MDH2154214.1 DUF3307 domain-containing protein [Stenotrophomonas sp. GD03657]
MFGTNTILWFAVFMALLLIKHYLIDFAIQGKYMTRRANKKDWLMPLVAHSSAHGIATLILLLPFGYIIEQVKIIALVALVDAVCHFVIDLSRSRLFRYNVFQPSYWTVHGMDQLLHNLTYVVIAAYICRSSLV